MIKIDYKETNKDILVTAKEFVKGEPGPQGPIGPSGPRGPAGVVVDKDEPAEALVWLIPDGDPSGASLTETKVNEMITQALEPYALKTDIPEVPDVSGFQTAEQVQAAINEALGVIENGTY